MYKISFANIAIISQLAVVNVRLLLIQRNGFTIFERITVATTIMKKLIIAAGAFVCHPERTLVILSEAKDLYYLLYLP